MNEQPHTGPPMRRSRRPWLYIGAAFAVCVLLVIALLVVLTPDRTDEPARQDSQTQRQFAPSGVVTVTIQVGVSGFELAFHDATTGRTSRTVKSTIVGVVDQQDIRRMRARFNANFTMLAWTAVGGRTLHIAKLTPEGYTEAGRWSPAPHPDYGTTWSEPTVNPVTGRVWLRETRSAHLGGGSSSVSIRIVSIDPGIAGDTPKVESDDPVAPLGFDQSGAPARERGVALVDDPAAQASLVTTDAQLLYGTVALTKDDVEYYCSATGPDTGLCFTETRHARYGSVAELRYDRAAQHLAMRQVVPTLDASLLGMVVSPDRGQLRLRTSDGWLSCTLPVAAAPMPVEMDQSAGQPLAWI